jgi:transketolase
MAIATRRGYDDLPELLTALTGDEKHDRSVVSTLDVLWVLYDRVLGAGDRFLLSKGHGPAAYYAVLAAKGLIPVEALGGFGGFDSPLGYHPDRVLAPGVELSSGSLGHGLPIAVGVALAGRPTFVLVGDGELDEGSNWEAVQYAGRIGLGRLTAVVVDQPQLDLPLAGRDRRAVRARGLEPRARGRPRP